MTKGGRKKKSSSQNDANADPLQSSNQTASGSQQQQRPQSQPQQRPQSQQQQRPQSQPQQRPQSQQQQRPQSQPQQRPQSQQQQRPQSKPQQTHQSQPQQTPQSQPQQRPQSQQQQTPQSQPQQQAWKTQALETPEQRNPPPQKQAWKTQEPVAQQQPKSNQQIQKQLQCSETQPQSTNQSLTSQSKQRPQSQPQQKPQSQQQQRPQSQPQQRPKTQQQQRPQSKPQQTHQSQPQQTPQSQPQQRPQSQQQQTPQSQPQQQAWKTQALKTPEQRNPPPQKQAWKTQALETPEQQNPPPQKQAWKTQALETPEQRNPPPQKQAWKTQEPVAQQQPKSNQQIQKQLQCSETQPQSTNQSLTSQSKQAQTKTTDVQEVSEKASKLSVKDNAPSMSTKEYQSIVDNIPRRKNPQKAGTLGRPIEVLTNMFPIKFGSKFQSIAVHYDVEIVPNIPKYLMRSVFKETKNKLFPNRNPAFDGKKNAFSAGYLPIASPETTSVTIYNEDGKEKNFKVTIKVANEINLSWLRNVRTGMEIDENYQIGIQALDVILRDSPAYKSTIVGRSFFSQPKGQIMSLGGGMDIWVGLFQSAIIGWKPYLNVDVVHKGFPKPQNVIDLMKTICSGEGRGQQGYEKNVNDPNTLLNLIHTQKETIRKFLKNLKVTIEIPGQPTSRRTQRVNDLVKNPRENTFEYNGSKISVEQYYRLEKKYVIKYPNLPCLWVGPKEKNIHVPPEICTLVSGQATQKTLNETQTAAMVRYAATGTNIRKQKILDAFNSMEHNKSSCMKEFDISISGEFEKVPARVLEPPQLQYKNRVARVAKGVWRPDKFLSASSLISNDGSWTILNLNKYQNERELYTLNNLLIQAGNNVDMYIGKPLTPFKTIALRGSDIRELLAYFNEQKRNGLKLIIVIVPEMKGLYSKVKQITELNVGVLTQCLKSKTLMKLSDATIVNILLKINAKLNGVNHMFESKISRPNCLNNPCMIVGADVTHPSPDAMDIPSIAAVAASHDPNAFKYNIEIRLQPPRQEVISNLTEIMMIHLRYFREKTGYQPSRIIFYRDGVSEGQFYQIMNEELRAIRTACQKLNQSYKPHITFLVVQKRHHIRLFPIHPKFSDDAHKNFNVQAGTIVDTEITHPSQIDFYLVSHASIQGTARPTKYRCLWDDSDMSENEIENLTYFLCHMFSRCTRSVSYPTPTYYAHLAAFRARALTQDVPISLTNLQQEQHKKLTINSEILKGMPMFFV